MLAPLYFFIGMVHKCEHALVEVRQPARVGFLCAPEDPGD